MSHHHDLPRRRTPQCDTPPAQALRRKRFHLAHTQFRTGEAPRTHGASPAQCA